MILEEDDFTEISGIGKKTEEKLKEAGFKTYKDLEKASIEQLTSVKGIFNATVEKIKAYFNNQALNFKNEGIEENKTKEVNPNPNPLRKESRKKVIPSSNLDRFTKIVVKASDSNLNFSKNQIEDDENGNQEGNNKKESRSNDKLDNINDYDEKIKQEDIKLKREAFEDNDENLESNDNEEEILGEEISELPNYDHLSSVLNGDEVKLKEEGIENNDYEDLDNVDYNKKDYDENEFNGDFSKLHDISRLLEKVEVNDNKNISTVIDDFINSDKSEPDVTIEEEKVRNEKKLSLLQQEEKEKEKSQVELLSDIDIQKIINTSKDVLKSQNYYVLSKKIKGIDLLALKIVKAKNLVDHIVMIPLKVSTLKGSIIISNDTLKYVSADHLPKQAVILVQRKYLDVFVKDIVKVPKIIYRNLCKEGSIFRFLKSYLKLNIKIEKSRAGTVLFFRDGLLQFKIFVEPLVICQDETHSSENSIAFPYYSEENLHVINCNKLQNLVEYLEVKYKTIEKYDKKKDNDIVQYFKVKNKTIDRLRLLSIPFIFYSGIFLLLIIFQLFEAIRVFTLLSYGVISIYFLIIIYLYYNFYAEKKGIIKRSEEPYYKKKVEIDDYDLNFIKEELDFDSLKQFSYECIDLENDLNLASSLNNTNNKQTEKKSIDLASEKNPLKSTTKSKYGTFLED